MEFDLKGVEKFRGEVSLNFREIINLLTKITRLYKLFLNFSASKRFIHLLARSKVLLDPLSLLYRATEQLNHIFHVFSVLYVVFYVCF